MRTAPRSGPRIALIVATAWVALACSDATSPAEPACSPETSSVEATVTVGASVTFDWTPKCAVTSVLVEEDASDMWFIASTEDLASAPVSANVITAPVRYGNVPSGIVSSYGPEPLVAGRRYSLALWRALPPGSATRCQLNVGTACLLTVKQFTR